MLYLAEIQSQHHLFKTAATYIYSVKYKHYSRGKFSAKISNKAPLCRQIGGGRVRETAELKSRIKVFELKIQKDIDPVPSSQQLVGTGRAAVSNLYPIQNRISVWFIEIRRYWKLRVTVLPICIYLPHGADNVYIYHLYLPIYASNLVYFTLQIMQIVPLSHGNINIHDFNVNA